MLDFQFLFSISQYTPFVVQQDGILSDTKMKGVFI